MSNDNNANNNSTEISERLRQVRRKIRLSQKAFGESLGFSQGYMSDIENFRTEPSRNVIDEIINVYNVNKDWLINGAGDIFGEEITKEKETGENNISTPADSKINEDVNLVRLEEKLKDKERLIQTLDSLVKSKDSEIEQLKKSLKRTEEDLEDLKRKMAIPQTRQTSA
jgi:transcriptional regulator with XRE-family HTH domain